MKIAFLNPWSKAAENQAFRSLSIAADRVGHELIHCANSAAVDECAPAFVLASASTQAKLNDVPHYGVIHEPRDRFLTNRSYYHNLLSYDGYLTIAETLDRFLQDVSFGTGNPQPVGFYYNTCQRQDVRTPLPELIKDRALRITYFGTNWDKRRQAFFERLSESNVQICGPEHSWSNLHKDGYGGPVPFDGLSVQAKYAANGVGLCMLSDLHLRDDIISNRIFEITSVGAIAFCCDIPWIRKHFGDSVYYFDQTLDDESLRIAIFQLLESVYRDPEAAADKASRARAIFEEKFAAEIMIGNAVRYHEQIQSERALALSGAERQYIPLVSVIVRCGSRPVEYVRRAVESIARQTYGRFEVILVRHKDIDLGSLESAKWPRIEVLRTVDSFGGNRSVSLWAGLEAVQGEYFSILDDDDWWFSNHMERLFAPAPSGPLKNFFACSGCIANGESVPIDGGASDTRSLHRFGIESTRSWIEVTGAFASNSFVASSDLLDPRLLSRPEMETAEDSYLILSLLAKAEPRFSYAATSVFDRSAAGQSGFVDHVRRWEDELTIQLRLLGRDRPRFVAPDAWKLLAQYWARRTDVLHPTNETDRKSEIEAILRDWEQVAAGYDDKRSKLYSHSRYLDPRQGSASIQTPPEPWAYGALLALNKPSRDALHYVIVAELVVRQGIVAAGILNPAEDDFLYRETLPARPQPYLIRVPVADLAQSGRLVIHNWESPGIAIVELNSLRLMAERL